ncbi:MAG: AAA family ATPase [Chitinophagales bacterium]|nr:AAA family ATPase [Chitinophagales bacterium]
MNKLSPKSYILPLIVITFSVLLYSFISQKICNLSIITVDSSFKYGYCLLIFTILYIFAVYLRVRYIPSIKLGYFLIVISIIYIYYRFCINDNIYLKLPNTPFYFEDVILFISILYFILYICRSKYTSSNWKKYNIDKNDFDDSELDFLKIKKLIEKDFIDYKGENSFTICLNGPYGIGKTTLLKSIYKVVKENNEVITCWFAPWLYKDKDLLTNGFLNLIEDKLSEYSGNITNQIDQLTASILKLGDNSLLDLIADKINTNSNAYELQEEIVESIKAIDKTTFVFIDDMDRLEKEEVLMVLKILRTISHFPNFVFIIGMDYKKVKDKIDEDSVYLDKFINLIYRLPNRDSNDLAKYFLNTYRNGIN